MSESPRVPFVDLKAQYDSLRPEIDAAIRDVIDSTQFINGPHCKAFEQELAQTLDGRHVVGCASCTAALVLLLQAYGIGPGHEVITTTHTYIATAEAISTAGAEVRFVDIAPDSHLMDLAAVEQALGPRTRAVIAVHLYGTPLDMDPLLDLARAHNLIVIEDCAQAQGSHYKGRPVGALGHAAAFSFFPSKNLGAAGDAGAVATSDPDIARQVRMLSNHGRLEKFTHQIEGGNHRLDNLQAAILRVKLPHLPAWIERRRAAAALYHKLLADCPGLELPFDPPYADSAWHLYPVQVDDPQGLSETLKTLGIATGFHYPLALHQQPAYARLALETGSLPNAERFCARTLSLPLFSDITDDQIRQTVHALRQALDPSRA